MVTTSDTFAFFCLRFGLLLLTGIFSACPACHARQHAGGSITGRATQTWHDRVGAFGPLDNPETTAVNENKAFHKRVERLVRVSQEKHRTGEALQAWLQRNHSSASWDERLTFAYGIGNTALLDSLLEEMKGSRGGDTGMTALMYAAAFGRFESVRKIIVLKYPESEGRAAFKYDNALIAACDNYGYSALMHAAAMGRVDIVNYLINAGAPIDNRCNIAKFDALQLAQNNNHPLAAAAIERELVRREQERHQFFKKEGYVWDISFYNGDLLANIMTTVAIILLAVALRWWNFLVAYRCLVKDLAITVSRKSQCDLKKATRDVRKFLMSYRRTEEWKLQWRGSGDIPFLRKPILPPDDRKIQSISQGLIEKLIPKT